VRRNEIKSENGVLVIYIRPETSGFNREQAEGMTGRPNPCLLHKIGMICGWE
jgi:hypothetical protein